MLTRILHNSDQLYSFFNELGLNLMLPQRQHLLNMADALLVCEDVKTLAALQRQFVQAPDASNMADFLRISPWQANDVRDALRQHQVARLLTEAEKSSTPPESKPSQEKPSPFSQQIPDSADNFRAVASPPAHRLESCGAI